ncbi:hypothetical protein HZB04_03325 [Candidatus Wolfebacteria bacterium]|nr:hypothetical protein [Candidatus Wolfebacteria bacterium]
MSKKTIIIAVGVIVLLVIAISIGIFFAIKTTEQISEIPAQTSIETRLPEKSTVKPRLSIISDQQVSFYWTVGDTIISVSSLINGQKSATSTQSILEKQILYFNQNGQILKINDKEDEILSGRQIDGIQSIKSSKDGSQIIVKHGVADSYRYEIFNVATKIWQALDNITAVDFSPDGSQIAYLENIKNSQTSNLIVKNLSGKKKTATIMAINQKDFDLKWIAPDKIFLVSKPSAFYQNEIWAISVKNKTLVMLGRDTGLIVNWAKDGSYGLKFSANQKGEGALNLIDKEGAVKANLNFKTMPEKCAITVNKIYCAVSYERTTIKEPFLPDDYLKKAVYFSDFIYEVDINENNFKTIFNETEPVLDAFNVSLFDDKILFMNKYDNKLYSLTL